MNVRGRFLIAPDGVIQAMEILTPPVGRNFSGLVRQIRAYQHTRDTGEVMPAGWRPGKRTLKPGIALASQVWQIWKPSDEA